MESDNLNMEQYQNENWDLIQIHIDAILKDIKKENLIDSFRQLFEVNILLGKDILVKSILRSQIHEENSSVLGALTSLINSELPEVGILLAKEATAMFIDGYNAMNNRITITMISLISQLFNYNVIHEIVILQLLHLLTEDIDNGSIDVIILLLRDSGKHLLELSKNVHNKVFENLREVLQNGKLPISSNNALEYLFDLRKSNYQNIGYSLIELPEHKINTLSFMIDINNYASNKKLGEFKYHDNYLELEKLFNEIKDHVLSKSSKRDNNIQTNIVEDMTGKNDIEFKKKIYLILKSSLSGDEAAHKILKLRVNDDKKYNVVDTIIKSSIQESTYSKFYGILCERLSTSHKSWKPAFEKIFQDNYINSEELEPNQLRIIGKFWGHMLASDYAGFEILAVVHISEDGTTPASRIFLKFVFQELVAEIGIHELLERLNEDFVKPHLVHMFPKENLEDIRYSINYFTAIGLGSLTEEMRKHLNIIEEQIQDQRREEETKKEEVYQKIRNERIKAGLKSRYNTDSAPNRAQQSRFSRNQSSEIKRSRSKTPPRRNTSRTPPRRTRSRTPPRRRV